MAELPETPLPRRALRKGTRSCAECKRRKTRCFYDRPTDASCVACQRRGMPCFGQQFVDVPLMEMGGEQTIVERLKRAEIILDTITKDISPTARNGNGVGNGQRNGEGRKSGSRSPLYKEAGMMQDGLQRSEGSSDDGSALGNHSDASGHIQCLPKLQVTEHGFAQFEYSDINNALHAGLPSQDDASLLIGTGMAIVFVQGIVNHYGDNLQSTTTLATLPPVSAHPVLLARKLFQLALCIQRLDPSLNGGVLKLGKSLPDAMWSYFNLASNMVTCHEELLDSIEGVECLLYQSVYLINSGNLRRALVSLRRASTVAQFMGLHRGVPYERLKRYDRTTNVSGAVAWARITYLEKFLSLLLGMPSATPRAMATSSSMATQGSSADWFERKQTEILERMVDRSQQRHYDDLAMTTAIDRELNQLASDMPAKWWAPMDLSQSTTSKDVLVRIISAQLQIVHYNLLTVLHLPYLLRDASNDRYVYSKTTCIYASREVLNRWIAFRSTVKVVLCCRPVDFCAFTAALALLLAYLDSHSHKQDCAMMLTHQRLGDRALIESALETMNELNALNNDELSKETAALTRRLLDLEAECAKGGQTYSSSSVDGYDDTNDENVHHMQIPYFGTIKLESPSASILSSPPPLIQYQPSSYGSYVQEVSPNDQAQIPFGHSPFPPSQMDSYQSSYCHYDTEMPHLMASANDWAFQGVDSTFFNALFAGNPPSQVTDDEVWGGYMLSV
ncbi:hypothetical protein BDV19DRAFT_368142 [Aspergillus venezuelensis]